jgi:EpsI family protein
MYAKMAQRHEPVTFWFVVGEHIAVTGQQQKLAQLRYGMRGIIPDGMLVRVSSINPDTEAAYRQQARFIADMRAAMPQSARLRVFGSALAS